MKLVRYSFRLAVTFLSLVILVPVCIRHARAQGPCGGKPCPVIRITRPPTPPASPGSGGKGRSPGAPRPPKTPPPPCEDAELVVVCGMPGCEITIDGRDRQATDDRGGIAFQVEGNRSYKIRIEKPGYESFAETVKRLDCDEQREVKASLKAYPVALRVRTQPASCDIYLDGDKQPSGSDGQGLFSFVLSQPTLLIEARKKGYLTAMKNVVLVPELAGREIVMALDPISATLQLSANVASARVTVDNRKSAKPITDRISLSPGAHTILIEALGYSPIKLELKVNPDEQVSREVKLERLPVLSLQSQATALFANRAYDDALKLCSYIREADRNNAIAHKLVGLVYLERADFGKAEGELDKALAGSESFALPVRRHGAEKFDIRRGHDACDAQLFLSKNQVEFKSVRNPAENFKVTYDQMQVVGIQVKNSTAVYLSTKVSVGGKRRDYNFYSFDRELSQAGRPYLEMIRRLLRTH